MSPLLSERAVADMLGLSPRTLQRLRQTGGGPPYIRLGTGRVRGRIMYEPDVIGPWLDGRRESSTSERAAAA